MISLIALKLVFKERSNVEKDEEVVDVEEK